MNHSYDRRGKRVMAWLVLALGMLMVVLGISSGIRSSEQIWINDWLPTLVLGVTGMGLSGTILLPPKPEWLRKGAHTTAVLGALSGFLLLLASIWW